MGKSSLSFCGVLSIPKRLMLNSMASREVPRCAAVGSAQAARGGAANGAEGFAGSWRSGGDM